jgi:hypothetical protein
MACDHSGTHSGELRYLRKHGRLRLLIVCDRCGAECAELGFLDYRPDRPLLGDAARGHGRAASRGPRDGLSVS